MTDTSPKRSISRNHLVAIGQKPGAEGRARKYDPKYCDDVRLYAQEGLFPESWCARIGITPSRALGVVDGDRLIAGVVYERFNGIHMEVSIAAQTGAAWASRQTLRHLFGHPP